jgi:hypothetical protein
MILDTWLEGTFTKSQELLTLAIIIILRKPWTLLTLGNGNISVDEGSDSPGFWEYSSYLGANVYYAIN